MVAPGELRGAEGVQQQAIALGGSVSYLDPGEAELSERTNRSVVDRPWELWKSELDEKT